MKTKVNTIMIYMILNGKGSSNVCGKGSSNGCGKGSSNGCGKDGSSHVSVHFGQANLIQTRFKLLSVNFLFVCCFAEWWGTLQSSTEYTHIDQNQFNDPLPFKIIHTRIL